MMMELIVRYNRPKHLKSFTSLVAFDRGLLCPLSAINYASILSIAVCGVYWFLSVKETNLIGWGRLGCLWIGCLGLTVNINSRVLLSFFYFQIFNYSWVLLFWSSCTYIYRQLAGVTSLYFLSSLGFFGIWNVIFLSKNLIFIKIIF